MIGQTLGHYRVLELLGKGGMGEVYRAEDMTLGREVAIKVLPQEFTENPERLARFEREAKLLATLNHPHIAQIHALEEVDGQRLLVMELVEGETLAERLSRGSLAVEDALPVALQITQALEAAHERGIVHRDLKPANIKITLGGEVKVLDFGLAKPITDAASGDLSHSPTLTYSPTRAGVLLGTASYMSPEQARGQEVDRRTDIWSFGVVLWEMLTGRHLFDGETVSDILAGVLKEEPPWELLPADLPRPIQRVLHRSLTRDRKERLHDIADARLEIEEAIVRPDGVPVDREDSSRPRLGQALRTTWPVVVAAIAVGALLASAIWWGLTTRPESSGRPARVALTLPEGITIHVRYYDPMLTMSPDGRWLVFAATEHEPLPLFKRSLEHFDATPMVGTEGGRQPFFSPDGRWVGFFAEGKLKKVALEGGPPQVLTEAPNPSGASWGPDGTIVLNRAWPEGLWRVPDTGGEPEQLAAPEFDRGDLDFFFPDLLPGGRAVVFTVWRGINEDSAQVAVLDLDSGVRRTLIDNAYSASYVTTGHLIFGKLGRIYVVPFDAERLEVTGPPVPVPEPILSGNGTVQLTYSSNGTLAFIPGARTPERQLVSVDLEGKEAPLLEWRRAFTNPRFSPDGQHLAVAVAEPGDSNIWVVDLTTGARTKLTHEGGNFFPLWTPDGDRVSYLSVPGTDEMSIDLKRADGHNTGQPFFQFKIADGLFLPGTWSPDGETLVYTRRETPSKPDGVWASSRHGDPRSRPLVETGANNRAPAVSPDGKWLAYVSTESGQSEVYVQPFPDGGERHQVSTDGGEAPIWSPDGGRIYFRSLRFHQVLEAPVITEPLFRTGSPEVLFEGSFADTEWTNFPGYDVAPDGKSFVMVKPDEEWGKATEIAVVFDWFEELKRLKPAEQP